MTNNNQPFSEKKASPNAVGCLAVFFSIFLVIGMLFSWKFLITPVIKIIQAQTWVKTPCKVISSTVEEKSDSDGSTYKVNIEYKYIFNDVEYQSNQYNFISTYTSGYKAKANIIRNYPPNYITNCYVNSHNPSQAVINPGISADLIYGIIPLIFVLVGGGGIAFVIHLARKPKAILATTPQLNQYPRNLPNTHFDKENIPLHPSIFPYQKALGIGFICLFWNAIVSIFLVNMYTDGSSTIMKLFLTPFVLIGLCLVYGLVVSIKAIFAPRPEFFINRPSTPLGGKLRLSWVIAANPINFRSMTISLQGYEESKYCRGTDTYTDKETFYQKELLKTSNPSEMAKSHILIDIPSNTIPSLTGENNKIIWCVLVKVIIEGWANLEESYNIVITSLIKH